MELFHHITVLFLDAEEKNGLVKMGVVFKTVAKGSRGENATFEIAENDPNWPLVDALLSSIGESGAELLNHCALWCVSSEDHAGTFRRVPED